MIQHPQRMQEHDLILWGQRVHYWQGGSGPGILLLHSAWGDAEMSWSRVWNELSGSFTVIAPDLPGFGRSSPIPDPALPRFAKVLEELLDAVHPGRVFVAGNSFSAAVAVQLAADYPETIARLVLVNGGYMPAMPVSVKFFLGLPLVRPAFRFLMRKAAFSKPSLKKAFVDEARLPEGFFRKIKQNEAAYSRIPFTTFMAMTGPLPAPSVPVHLIWGAQDGLTPLAHARELQKRMPDATLITIEGAGHMPQVEQPQEFVKAIRETAATGL